MSNVNLFDNVRAAVYARLDAYHSATRPLVPVQYQNRNVVDIDQMQDPWIDVAIVWNDGDVAALGTTPLARYRGAIWLSIFVKKNTGSSFTSKVMGELADLFKAVRDPSYYTGVAVPVPVREYKGWQVQTLRVPFWTDDR